MLEGVTGYEREGGEERGEGRHRVCFSRRFNATEESAEGILQGLETAEDDRRIVAAVLEAEIGGRGRGEFAQERTWLLYSSIMQWCSAFCYAV